jgi:predicted nucleotidyltransferase
LPDPQALLTRLADWAESDDDIVAIALVGSHARGAARPDSDVDVIILTEHVGRFLAATEWTREFGDVATLEREDWGMVQALRVTYRGGLEVEFGLTTPQWAAVAPIEPGTQRVVANGCRIVSDRQ